ncbi:MAG: N-acetylglucosamine-6-phosphate deacetylase [Acidimicrobiales bacterium]
MTSPLHIVGGRALVEGAFRPSTVTIVDETIDSIAEPTDQDGQIIDADGLLISPGFIDLQINGGFGIDLVDDPEGMWALGSRLPQCGVTSFLPTIITSPSAVNSASLEALHKRPASYRGAEPLGLHFEGPMLSPQQPGAHPKQHLASPTMQVIDGWSRAAGVALVTIAPELPNAMSIIAELVDRGVTVAAGHTEATDEQAFAALDAGVTMVTHLFNAMSPLGHRQPNLVGVALASRELPVGLIVDGVHVDPTVIAATWHTKGAAGIALVTDAVAPMGQGPGRFEFAGQHITADSRCVRNSAGTLAGSILTMDQAVRNLTAFTGCSSEDALATATATPAQLVREFRRGCIARGAIADLVLLDDELNVELTICGGRIAYVSDSARLRLPATHRNDDRSEVR